MQAPTPQRFGRYTLTERVGAGGMAEVHRARLTGPAGVEKTVVIKRIKPELAQDERLVALFLDETRVAARLQHPNIVAVFDFGEVEGRYFMAMEHVSGADLGDVMRALHDGAQRMPVDLAVLIAHEIARALEHAHGQRDDLGRPLGLVHRDICHSNVLIAFDGGVKVADFGVARSTLGRAPTAPNKAEGHVATMSPEQAAGEPLDGRSDLFSLGVVLHELLTGRRLFRRETQDETLRAVCTLPAPPPSASNPKVDAELDAIVLRLLAKAPADRYADATAARVALATALGPVNLDVLRERLGDWLGVLLPATGEGPVSLSSIVPPAAPLPDTVALAPPRPRWVAPTFIVALLCALTVLGAGLWLWTRPAPVAPVVPFTPPLREEAAPLEEPTARPAPPPSRPARPAAQKPPSAEAPPAKQPAPAAPPPPQDDATITLPDAPPAEPAAPPEPVTVDEPAHPPAPTAADEPAPPEEPAADTPGTLTIQVREGTAWVSLDGHRVKGSPPFVDLPITPGTHVVTVEKPATGRVYTRQFTVKPGKPVEVVFD